MTAWNAGPIRNDPRESNGPATSEHRESKGPVRAVPL